MTVVAFAAPEHDLTGIEAEQALLGALLMGADGFDAVQDISKPAHFCEPLHARLFEAIAEQVGVRARQALGEAMNCHEAAARPQVGRTDRC